MTDAETSLRAERAAGLAVHHLWAGTSSLGDAAIRERESGLRWWSRPFAFERFAFGVGADYAYTRHEYDGLASRDRDLHRIELSLRWRDHDDRWLVALTPVIATSSNVFKDLPARGGRDDIELHGRWQHQRWNDASRGWRVALVRDSAFGAPRFYPTAALLWRGARLDAELGLPVTRFEWRALGGLALGGALFPAGGHWHVVSDERGGAEFDYRARAWRGAATARWQALPRLRVGAQLGIEFARRYEFEDDTGAPIRRDAASAAFYRIEVRYDFD